MDGKHTKIPVLINRLRNKIQSPSMTTKPNLIKLLPSSTKKATMLPYIGKMKTLKTISL